MLHSVSFSEEKPRIKFIPGSAEQRGTNFMRALQGDRPFCRPLKHKGGCFLLNAYVDNITKDKLHLGLQARALNPNAAPALCKLVVVRHLICSYSYIHR